MFLVTICEYFFIAYLQTDWLLELKFPNFNRYNLSVQVQLLSHVLNGEQIATNSFVACSGSALFE